MENVESFVFDQVTVDVPDLGPMTVEIVYSGIFFVMIDASQLEPALARENVDRLSELALRIRDTVTGEVDIVNPPDRRTGAGDRHTVLRTRRPGALARRLPRRVRRQVSMRNRHLRQGDAARGAG
jgi:proline racemase